MSSLDFSDIERFRKELEDSMPDEVDLVSIEDSLVLVDERHISGVYSIELGGGPRVKFGVRLVNILGGNKSREDSQSSGVYLLKVLGDCSVSDGKAIYDLISKSICCQRIVAGLSPNDAGVVYVNYSDNIEVDATHNILSNSSRED